MAAEGHIGNIVEEIKNVYWTNSEESRAFLLGFLDGAREERHGAPLSESPELPCWGFVDKAVFDLIMFLVDEPAGNKFVSYGCGTGLLEMMMVGLLPYVSKAHEDLELFDKNPSGVVKQFDWSETSFECKDKTVFLVWPPPDMTMAPGAEASNWTNIPEWQFPSLGEAKRVVLVIDRKDTCGTASLWNWLESNMTLKLAKGEGPSQRVMVFEPKE